MSDLNEILDKIERKEKRASKGPWKVADSCSWRRIVGGVCGEGVIVPTKNTVDGHPDLIARRDDLEFAADSRTTVPALLRAARRSVKFADLLRRNGQHGYADDLEELISEALEPLAGGQK